jgi:phosphoribosylglycinamide formyltransferase-1
MKNIVIFASGSGSNAEKIMSRFHGGAAIKVAAVFTNKPEAGVVEKASKHDVPVVVFNRTELESGSVLRKLATFNPQLVVLAGFLIKVPDDIIAAYPRKIVNIHPALLPKFGGKGMYGMNVHRAVSEQREAETGITIHYVDGHYDSGDVIFQAKVALSGTETCEEISAKVQELEHRHYPEIIKEMMRR